MMKAFSEIILCARVNVVLRGKKNTSASKEGNSDAGLIVSCTQLASFNFFFEFELYQRTGSVPLKKNYLF